MTYLQDELEKDGSSKEPARKVGISTAAVAGIGTLLLYFFPDIPDNVIQLILVALAFLLPIVTSLITRNFVWSPASVFQVVSESVKDTLKQPASKVITDTNKEERLKLRKDLPTD